MSILIEPAKSNVVAMPDLDASCVLGTSVGDAVYVKASNLVAPAVATSLLTMPAIGIVVQLLNPITCKVRRMGEVIMFAGLVPGKPYWVSKTIPGAITPFPPVSPAVVQEMGWAISPFKFAVDSDPDLFSTET